MKVGRPEIVLGYDFFKNSKFSKKMSKISKKIFSKISKKYKKNIESMQIDQRFFSYNFLTIPIPVIFLQPMLVLC